jgi:hypothetical protein
MCTAPRPAAAAGLPPRPLWSIKGAPGVRRAPDFLPTATRPQQRAEAVLSSTASRPPPSTRCRWTDHSSRRDGSGGATPHRTLPGGGGGTASGAVPWVKLVTEPSSFPEVHGGRSEERALPLPASQPCQAVGGWPFTAETLAYGCTYNMFMTITDLINYYLSVPRSTVRNLP